MDGPLPSATNGRPHPDLDAVARQREPVQDEPEVARRYGYRYGYGRRRGSAAGSAILLLVLGVLVLAGKHPGYAILVGILVVAIFVAVYASKARKAWTLRRAVKERKQFWRETPLVPGPYTVYLNSVPDKAVANVRDSLQNLDRNPAVADLDVEHVLRRAKNISATPVLSGVDEDLAVDLKEELEHWGGKVRIKEDAVPVVRQPGKREPIPERVRHEVWRRDGGQCVDCGSRVNLEFDHIVPWSKGGANTARNLELRCQTCNRKKAAKI
ncbi:MAG: HNH endonuclease [Gaiellaceae bacterium]